MSLIRNVLPEFYNNTIEKLEDLHEDVIEDCSSSSSSSAIENPNASINHSHDIHDHHINHVLQCIKCRNYFLEQLSFADKNREIVDMFPYILILIILIFVIKH